MLHQRTSSATNLRMESSRRHAIRNLRAKVRSLLPPEMCPREQKRHTRGERSSERSPFGSHSLHSNKQFEKLTRKQVEQVNQNKHYFLGNEESIARYEHFLNDYYPELKNREWTIPSPNINILPLAFVPTSLFNSIAGNSFKNISSQKKMTEKRISYSRSVVQIKRNQSKESCKEKRQNVQKAEQCLNRRQAIEQELKVRRQIGSVNLQRQQQLVQIKKDNFIKERALNCKLRQTYSGSIKKPQSQAKNKYIQFEVAELATKLRKICLQRSRHHQ